MQAPKSPWLLALLLLQLLWLGSRAGATVQLAPVTNLEGWQASASGWVLNAARAIAAGSALHKNEVHVLQLQKGTWLLADVLTPPEPHASFVPGSVLLSDDGRLLAVAAQQQQQQQQLTVGYVYKVVAHSHSQHAFRYQLAARLSVPGNISGNAVTPQLDMTADGHTILACWTGQPRQGAAAATAGSLQPSLSSAGAAVFSWKKLGQSMLASQLAPPAGSTSFGQGCRLSADGQVALVTDARGGMVYQRETHAPRSGTAAAYRAAGWLAGSPAREQYRVLAADLTRSGRQAVMLVQGVRPSTWSSSGSSSYASLKVFAGGTLGHWSDVCTIQLNHTTPQTGAVQLAEFPGGVHVWTAHSGVQLMFDVGLQGVQLAHCPTRPVLTALTAASGTDDDGAQPSPSPAAPAHHKSPRVRTGVLTVAPDGSQATFKATQLAAE